MFFSDVSPYDPPEHAETPDGLTIPGAKHYAAIVVGKIVIAWANVEQNINRWIGAHRQTKAGPMIINGRRNPDYYIDHDLHGKFDERLTEWLNGAAEIRELSGGDRQFFQSRIKRYYDLRNDVAHNIGSVFPLDADNKERDGRYYCNISEMNRRYSTQLKKFYGEIDDASKFRIGATNRGKRIPPPRPPNMFKNAKYTERFLCDSLADLLVLVVQIDMVYCDW